MTDPPLTSEARLRLMCDDVASRATVERTSDGLPEWVVDNGRLRNTRADYFSLGLYAADGGRTLFLMEQS